ncbi:hypothetical protein [Alkalicoccus daliensis]|uniref:Uncharacterized protein n=1 Tax=Alkalicoccus daliensis TaxID=745820 RepID=A0A1H0D2H9_9BACI|nr:hypothetical protein [Alkalicoccus daliensis]SDN64256.1 hypothetical protein SAMN04488053_102318 [Alkalicoccus daliensis]
MTRVQITIVVATAVYIALDYADVGGTIAKIIDSKDWYRNTGWMDIAQ